MQPIKIETVVIFLIFLTSVLLRLPAAIFQELPPFQFCDEKIFSEEVFQMLREGRFMTKEFRSGGINIYPGFILGKVFYCFTGRLPSYIELIVMTRILMTVVLSAVTVFIINKTGKLIFAEKYQPRLIMLLAFLISPMASGISRIWYPDHYVIFFSAGSLLYIMKLFQHEQKWGDYLWGGVFIGMTISTKYTGLFLLLPCVILFIYKILNNEINIYPNFKNRYVQYITLYSLMLLSLLTTIIILQFSAINNFQKFLSDWNYNLINYSRFGDKINWLGMRFYFVILFMTSLGILALPVYFYGCVRLFIKSKIQLFVLLSFPVFLIIYLGKVNLVINRNMMIALPFVLPVFAAGLDYILDKVITHLTSYTKIILIIFVIALIAEPAYKTLYEFIYDWKLDSRVLARNWLDKNIPPGSVIMHNEVCTGESAARKDRYKLISEHTTAAIGNVHHEYFVFNSWFGGRLAPFKERKGMLLETAYRNLHFLHFSDIDVFSSQNVSSDYASMKLLLGEEMIKEFHGSGPVVFITKTVNK
jgi:hypothetical protein